jgi:hypothetical protein
MAVPLTPQNSKNDRPLDSTPTSHQSKRPDTTTTPRSDPMIMDVEQHSENIGEHALQLFSKDNHPRELNFLSTQPALRPTPPRDLVGNREPLPVTPKIRSPVRTPSTSPIFQDMAALLAAQDSPQYPNGYDTDNPQYVYKDNGTGRLFLIGLAQPCDFHSDGTIRGSQPTEDQSEVLCRIFYGSPPHPNQPSHAPIPRTPSPENTMATQDETEGTSTTSSPQGPPLHEQLSQSPVMGYPSSLLAEGAKTDNE